MTRRSRISRNVRCGSHADQNKRKDTRSWPDGYERRTRGGRRTSTEWDQMDIHGDD